ncbi:Type III secretion host injection protein (YopB) [Vibrio harveyi]|uniref:type III secretion system translocon subunit SctE n=1 Tax=Vibrio harveyi TaxID=669 RepID=UPI001EFE72A3|nr:type III secretion system translocon subunit SctE [Vibrio harveyi]MCG9233679.1 type III secretion system translocon subunit SctE [Vibrio harveyi]MCG9586523.1 type III secretion system translocon subunit SctE [Vibrio harveyi]CAH1200153.1 Type III secretion host injection protein (YopB) [Vibrio harveyi]CAH1547601.1 Type III secretion host injection protein (YopB) [Vibrio harveyi]CAH1549061.1 Type III secretion host injection protein (YopB) [Vibrio harveyi]
MNSIALSRTQSQIYTPGSDQTTLDKVTKTASHASPSVTVENVKGKDAEALNTGKVKVQLDAPNAAVSDKVDQLTLKAMAQLQKVVDSFAKTSHALADVTGSLAVKIIAGSADDFEVELAAITDKLKSAQNELKIQELKGTKAKNEREIKENQQKLKESEEAGKEAKKSGLASKIFGWVSAAVSIVVGAVLVATGVGAAAGALMIAGGVMGAVSMALQEPAVQDALKEVGVNVDTLSKVMMALEIAVAVIGAIVTFGGAAAGGIAKLAAKGASKVAQKVTDIATKAAANLTKVADMGSKSATTVAKGVRFAAESVDLATNIGKGAADSVNSNDKAKVIEIDADLARIKAERVLTQAAIDKLKDEISKLMDGFQELMSVIMQMIQAKGETMQAVMSRPATV